MGGGPCARWEGGDVAGGAAAADGDGGGAVREVEVGRLRGVVGVAGAERVPAAAVAVQVDEAGHDDVLAGPVVRGDLGDQRPVDAEAAGEYAAGTDDLTADHRFFG